MARIRLNQPARIAIFSLAALSLASVTLAAQAPAARPSPPVPAPPAQTAPRFTVLLDAAHGGDDSGGSLNGNQKEKSVTLTFSVRLRSLLAARGIQAVTTREEDKTLTWSDRAALANKAAPQACISLHAAETGSGVHLFTSSLPPAAAARFSAWKTAQSATVTRSLALAGVLNSALTDAGFNVTLGRTALPGIDSMTCPAIALELAPQRDSSHKITAEPGDAAYQASIAQALATALLQWKSESSQRPESNPGARLP